MSTAANVDTATTESITPTPVKVGVGVILIPVLLSTVLTLGVVGGGAFYLIRSGKLGTGVQNTAAQPAVAPIIVVAPPASHVLALEPMIVNLSDANGRAYLRASVSLRIKDEEKTERLPEKKDPKAVDAVATELRDTTLAVLSRQTSDGLLLPDGREALKQTLEHEYKVRNTEIPVFEIYFTDFLVQRG
ncbi:flagellar basal body-associated protein FliL [Terriglobus sp. TAA 43]|uniref:flagellar basal body-associated FliL family protein n=1 Tax=Terriglobus sp. TAA 43 TaxID=278961 RepID=UPI00064797F1|nr:flagellar basal body-associated FliL family protein [Terriglobus sp. TAA 43]